MKSPRVVKVAVGRDRDHIVSHKFKFLQVVEEAVLGEKGVKVYHEERESKSAIWGTEKVEIGKVIVYLKVFSSRYILLISFVTCERLVQHL